MFRLDKTIGKGHKHEDVEKDSDYLEKKSVNERLETVMYINSVAYDFDINHPPKLDRTVFSMRKHKMR